MLFRKYKTVFHIEKWHDGLLMCDDRLLDQGPNGGWLDRGVMVIGWSVVECWWLVGDCWKVKYFFSFSFSTHLISPVYSSLFIY